MIINQLEKRYEGMNNVRNIRVVTFRFLSSASDDDDETHTEPLNLLSEYEDNLAS